MSDIKSRIQDKVRKGMKPKMAIAKSLAEDFKAKKMAEGGMVEDPASDEGEAGEPVNPERVDDEGLSENVMIEQKLAESLQSAKYRANDDSTPEESEEEDAPAISSDMMDAIARKLKSRKYI